MPRLRRLSGSEVIAILRQFGFEVVRISGSHHILERIVSGETQTIVVPVHGKQQLKLPTLLDIYRQASRHVTEEEARKHFYS